MTEMTWSHDPWCNVDHEPNGNPCPSPEPVTMQPDPPSLGLAESYAKTMEFIDLLLVDIQQGLEQKDAVELADHLAQGYQANVDLRALPGFLAVALVMLAQERRKGSH